MDNAYRSKGILEAMARGLFYPQEVSKWVKDEHNNQKFPRGRYIVNRIGAQTIDIGKYIVWLSFGMYTVDKFRNAF